MASKNISKVMFHNAKKNIQINGGLVNNASYKSYFLHINNINITFQVYQQVLNDQGRSLLDSLVASVTAEKSAIENVRYQHDLLSICERINGVCNLKERNFIQLFSVLNS
jgi:hypothetical protein